MSGKHTLQVPPKMFRVNSTLMLPIFRCSV